MSDIAELAQRVRNAYLYDGNGILVEKLQDETAAALEAQAKRIAELGRHIVCIHESGFYRTGFAQAIEMAADTAEEWFFSEEAAVSDLDALIDAIKALKPPRGSEEDA